MCLDCGSDIWPIGRFLEKFLTSKKGGRRFFLERGSRRFSGKKSWLTSDPTWSGILGFQCCRRWNTVLTWSFQNLCVPCDIFGSNCRVQIGLIGVKMSNILKSSYEKLNSCWDSCSLKQVKQSLFEGVSWGWGAGNKEETGFRRGRGRGAAPQVGPQKGENSCQWCLPRGKSYQYKCHLPILSNVVTLGIPVGANNHIK